MAKTFLFATVYMATSDVSDPLKETLKITGLPRSRRLKLLSDNGPCYIVSELQNWLEDHDMKHPHGKP